MLQQMKSRTNHISYRNFHFNEFVATALYDNIGYKKKSVNDEIKLNNTQWHKVNDFDFCFVPKCLHVSNPRTKPAGLDF